MSSENLHEKQDALSRETLDRHRAYVSLTEEIDAIDWYSQRIDAVSDESLKKILAHNRDEEIEHACMALEWLRRNAPGWEETLKTYLFKEGPETEIEEKEEAENESEAVREKDLKIGKL